MLVCLVETPAEDAGAEAAALVRRAHDQQAHEDVGVVVAHVVLLVADQAAEEVGAEGGVAGGWVAHRRVDVGVGAGEVEVPVAVGDDFACGWAERFHDAACGVGGVEDDGLGGALRVVLFGVGRVGRGGAEHELVHEGGVKGLVLDGGEGGEVGVREPWAYGDGVGWQGRGCWADHHADGFRVGDPPGVEINGSGGDFFKPVLDVEALAGWGGFKEGRKAVGVGKR